MNEKLKSQKGFVAVTLITVLAIALVLIVYATLLGVIPGGEVTVGGVTGEVGYSLNNQEGNWNTTLKVSGTGVAWYARFNTTGGEYAGNVSISWQLQKMGSKSDWSDATNPGSPTQYYIVLTTASQTLYASTDGSGTIGTNRDWSLTATTTGSYRVVVTIESIG